MVAVVGQSDEAQGRVGQGRQLAKASFWISIAGIIVGVAAWLAVGLTTHTTYYYTYDAPVAPAASCYYNNYGEYICNG